MRYAQVRAGTAVWVTPTGDRRDEEKFRLKARLCECRALVAISDYASSGQYAAVLEERARLMRKYHEYGSLLEEVLDDYVKASRMFGIRKCAPVRRRAAAGASS